MLITAAKVHIFLPVVLFLSSASVSPPRKDHVMRKVKILLIEDNRLLREGINVIVNEQADLRIVGAFGGNHETLLQARRLKPDVVILDLGLRNVNGLRVVTALTRDIPHVKVIGMGLIPSQLEIIEFVKAGASGFILKEATIEEFLATIRSVAKGLKILPPVLTGSLFADVVEHALRRGKGKFSGTVRMTKREREIIVHIAGGMSNKEIAQCLNLSTHTVKSHVHNILEKLALHSRLEIASHSYENEDL